MANHLLNSLLHLIQSEMGQKEEAKPGSPCPWERRQSSAAVWSYEVAGLPRQMGSPLGRYCGRASVLRAKSVFLPYTGNHHAARAVSCAGAVKVKQAITYGRGNIHSTDEVPRRPGLTSQVSPHYKSHTKGAGEASEVGTGSPRPHPKGCQQRQSRGRQSRATDPACSERQNLSVLSGSVLNMGTVSPAARATKWPDGTSSHQPAQMLRNMPQQRDPIRSTVRQS